MKPSDTLDAFRETAATQPVPINVHHVDVVMVFCPIISNEDHVICTFPSVLGSELVVEPKTPGDGLMDKCSNGTTSHWCSRVTSPTSWGTFWLQRSTSSVCASAHQPAAHNQASHPRRPDRLPLVCATFLPAFRGHCRRLWGRAPCVCERVCQASMPAARSARRRVTWWSPSWCAIRRACWSAGRVKGPRPANSARSS